MCPICQFHQYCMSIIFVQNWIAQLWFFWLKEFRCKSYSENIGEIDYRGWFHQTLFTHWAQFYGKKIWSFLHILFAFCLTLLLVCQICAPKKVLNIWHFTREFFAWNFDAKNYKALFWVWNFLAPKFCMINICAKCWCNWPLRDWSLFFVTFTTDFIIKKHTWVFTLMLNMVKMHFTFYNIFD